MENVVEDTTNCIILQDAMIQLCNSFYLGDWNKKNKKIDNILCRECRFGYETDVTLNLGDTPEKELRDMSTTFKDKRGVANVLLPRH